MTVTVVFVDHAPIAHGDNTTVYQNMSVIIDVVANDYDEDEDTMTIVVVSASNGQANITANNTIVYAPNPGYIGNDTIVYTIDDGHGLNDTATVNVTVLYYPTAYDQNATLLINNSLVIDVISGGIHSVDCYFICCL